MSGQTDKGTSDTRLLSDERVRLLSEESNLLRDHIAALTELNQEQAREIERLKEEWNRDRESLDNHFKENATLTRQLADARKALEDAPHGNPCTAFEERDGGSY